MFPLGGVRMCTKDIKYHSAAISAILQTGSGFYFRPMDESEFARRNSRVHYPNGKRARLALRQLGLDNGQDVYLCSPWKWCLRTDVSPSMQQKMFLTLRYDSLLYLYMIVLSVF